MIFQELVDVDKYFSKDFEDFIIFYRPISLNDIDEKLKMFSLIQTYQIELQTQKDF